MGDVKNIPVGSGTPALTDTVVCVGGGGVPTDVRYSLAQLQAAIGGHGGAGLIPIPVGGLNLYVSTTGSDANNGLTPATPFKTIQKAIDYVTTNYISVADPVNWGNAGCLIQLADGTYPNDNNTGGFTLNGAPLAGQGIIEIQGNVSDHTKCIILTNSNGGDGIIVQEHATYHFNFLTFQSNSVGGGGGTAIVFEQFLVDCYHSLNEIGFNGNWGNFHFGVNGGYVYIGGNLYINGTATNGLMWIESANAYVFMHHGQIVLNVDPHWGQGFVELNYQGRASFKTLFSGSVGTFTGPFFTIAGGCELLHTFSPGNGAGISSLPPAIDRGALVLIDYQGPGPFSSQYLPNLGMIPAGTNYKTPTTGTSITVADTDGLLLLEPAGTLAALTVVMCPDPMDGQTVAVQTTQAITTFTLNGNTGQTVANAPTALTVGKRFTAVYRAANTKWYCGS